LSRRAIVLALSYVEAENTMAGRIRDRKILLCVSIGCLLTLPAALLAIASAGAGHGNYLLARVLFPYTMLLTRLTDDTVTLPLIVLGLAQLPLYGAVVGLAASTGRVALTLAHLGAVVLCFSGAIPNFS